MRETGQFSASWIAMLAAGLGISLAGCAADPKIASVQDGAARVFQPPPHVILGKTRVDQQWIDTTVESGRAALGWPRPGPRPAGLDAPAQAAPTAPAAKKPSLWRRTRSRLGV